MDNTSCILIKVDFERRCVRYRVPVSELDDLDLTEYYSSEDVLDEEFEDFGSDYL